MKQIKKKAGVKRVLRDFGKLIRGWRGQLSRVELSILSDLPKSEIVKIEHGEANQVKREHLDKLIQTLFITLRKLQEEKKKRAYDLLKRFSGNSSCPSRIVCHGRRAPCRSHRR